MSPGRERRRIWPVAVMLALVALFLVANAALAWRNARAVAAAERSVAHTREVRLEVQALLSTVQDAESGQRGYLLTGEDAFLGPYRGAVARANARLTSLARLTPDDPEQEKSLAEVRRLAVARMTELGRLVSLQHDDPDPLRGAAAARQFVLSGKGQELMDALRRAASAMDDHEEARLAARERDSTASLRTATTHALTGLAAGLALVGLAFVLSRRHLAVRRRAAEALVAEREHLRTALADADERGRLLDALMENIPEGVAIADAPDVRLRMVSRYGRELTGRPREAVEGITAAELVERWDVYAVDGTTPARSEDLPVTRATQKGEIIRDEEWVLRTERGERIPVLCNAGPIRDASGSIVGGVVTWRDIRERKEAALLRASEERLRQAQEQLTAELEARSRLLAIGSLFIEAGNLEPVLSAIVDAAMAMSGADFASIQVVDRETGTLRIAAQRGFPKEWLDYWSNVEQGRGACGTALECLERVVVEDVERSPIFVGTPALEVQIRAGVRAVQSTPVVGRSGAPLGILSTHFKTPRVFDDRVLRLLDLLAGQTSDILERAQAEEALRASEERFRALTVASTQVIYRMSPDWTEMRQLHSESFLSSTEAVSRDWLRQYIPPEEQGRVLAAIHEAMRTESAFELEHRVVRADGTVGWTLSRAIPVKSANGEVVEWFGVASDVTQRRRIEQELEEANTRLLEADRRKDEFLAVLSHELRNPLAPIRNSVYILERAAASGQLAEHALAVIDRQVGHLARLVDDLLDVTRISHGKIRLQRERLDLRDIVRRAVEDHREVFRKKGIAFEAKVLDEPALCDGDPTRLAQAVGNLLSNAAKFTPKGGRVVLSLEAEGTVAVVRVDDTGAGMAAEVLSRLFEPFVQADQTLDRTLGGLGLGLALVKRLVEMHGGSASVHSEGAGQGAQFTIRLPLAQPSAVQPHPPPPSAARPLRRVLVIEDNMDAAITLKEALELDGHVVEIGTSGQEGIEKARSFRPDVVLCDLGLPGMDGYEVARRMRSDAEMRSLSLIALSGYALPEDVDRSRAAGFDRHVAKPVDLGILGRELSQEPTREPGAP